MRSAFIIFKEHWGRVLWIPSDLPHSALDILNNYAQARSGFLILMGMLREAMETCRCFMHISMFLALPLYQGVKRPLLLTFSSKAAHQTQSRVLLSVTPLQSLEEGLNWKQWPKPGCSRPTQEGPAAGVSVRSCPGWDLQLEDKAALWPARKGQGCLSKVICCSFRWGHFQIPLFFFS